MAKDQLPPPTDPSSVITACEEHGREAPELRFSETHGGYCPRCGKYKWLALHGVVAYDKSLIECA